MIPNVSAIYRDLATISEPATYRNTNTHSYNSYQPDPYAQKQKRHNDLMEKLRNAQQ